MRRPEYLVLHTSECEKYRILEYVDVDFDLENLKGDCFNPKANPNQDADTLKNEETQFETLVENEGVFGYVLERWNPAPGTGWEHLDSCWGFVGSYNPESTNTNHYIVEELKATIQRDLNNRETK